MPTWLGLPTRPFLPQGYGLAASWYPGPGRHYSHDKPFLKNMQGTCMAIGLLRDSRVWTGPVLMMY